MLLQQLKPSILTAAGLSPNFTGTQPAPLLRPIPEVKEGGGEGAAAAAPSGIASMGTKLSLPNWAS